MTSSLYRKKPVVISAIQWTGGNVAELIGYCGNKFMTVDEADRGDDPKQTAAIFDDLHNTWIHVYNGQWIIRGVQGELYPCADDVFTATYEAVES